jgi:hypothetical protein
LAAAEQQQQQQQHWKSEIFYHNASFGSGAHCWHPNPTGRRNLEFESLSLAELKALSG